MHKFKNIALLQPRIAPEPYKKMTPTIKTIADELGISISTVSRALHNNPRIGLKTREEVLKIAKRLNYTPNPLALNLQQKKTRTIGVIVPTLAEDYFFRIIQGIEKIISAEDYQFIIKYSDNDIEKEKTIIQSFIKIRVDGVLISLAANTNNYAHFIQLEQKGIPTVFFDRVPRNFPSFRVKNNIKKGVEDSIKYLFQKNYTKIALLNGPVSLLASDETLNGYLQAIKNFELTTSPKLIKYSDLSVDDTQTKTLELISQKPDAVIVFNDTVFMHAMRICQKHNIKNIAFISLGNLETTAYFTPKPLAYIDFHPFNIGEKAAEILLNHLKGLETSKEIIIESKLVEYQD